MNEHEVNTEAAKQFTPTPTPYEGGAVAKAREDERRLLMQYLPAGRFLDQEHLTACATGEHGGVNDPFRQGLLRKAGANVSRQLMLRPDEYDELVAHVRSPQSR